jgi:hypothetical protein
MKRTSIESGIPHTAIWRKEGPLQCRQFGCRGYVHLTQALREKGKGVLSDDRCHNPRIYFGSFHAPFGNPPALKIHKKNVIKNIRSKILKKLYFKNINIYINFF